MPTPPKKRQPAPRPPPGPSQTGSNEGAAPSLPTGAAQNVWLAGLGALASAQAEGSKAFESLVKQGLDMQTQAQELARERMAAMGDPGAVAPWGRLGGIFEDRVARALASMGMPTAHELALLTARVEALERAINRDRPAESATKATRKRSAPSRKSSG